MPRIGTDDKTTMIDLPQKEVEKLKLDDEVSIMITGKVVGKHEEKPGGDKEFPNRSDILLKIASVKVESDDGIAKLDREISED